jgi:hypothetical protein
MVNVKTWSTKGWLLGWYWGVENVYKKNKHKNSLLN